MFRCCSKIILESFSKICNLSVTTCVAVDYSREGFFLKGIFEYKQVTKSASGSRNNIKLTKWYIFLNCTTQMCPQIKRKYVICKLNLVFRSICRLGNLFRLKDSLEKKIFSGTVYRYTINMVTYYRKLSDIILQERLKTWQLWM